MGWPHIPREHPCTAPCQVRHMPSGGWGRHHRGPTTSLPSAAGATWIQGRRSLLLDPTEIHVACHGTVPPPWSADWGTLEMPSTTTLWKWSSLVMSTNVWKEQSVGSLPPRKYVWIISTAQYKVVVSGHYLCITAAIQDWKFSVLLPDAPHWSMASEATHCPFNIVHQWGGSINSKGVHLNWGAVSRGGIKR